MSQFAGDDTMSILDSINDGKHIVPKEPKPFLPENKVLKIIVLILLAVAFTALFASVIWSSFH